MINSGAMAAILSLLLEGSAQTITFGGPPPALRAAESATVTAVASSKLPVTFSSKTPDVCSVVANSGVVAAKAAGNCMIAADQAGNGEYDPAPQVTMTIAVAEAIPVPVPQTISFGFAPAVVKGGTVPISATATSGLPVMYANNTKDICTLTNASGGFTVTGNKVGKCSIVANQGGNANFNPAPPVELVIEVVVAPDTPTNVKASLGDEPNTVVVSFDAPGSGGSPITGYSVVGTKPGGESIAIPGAASPITVPCPVSCSGYAFSVAAKNAVAGTGTATAPVDVITNYKVVETFIEPSLMLDKNVGIVTLPNPEETKFVGTFTFNSTKSQVSELKGQLTKSWGSKSPVDLNNQLPVTTENGQPVNEKGVVPENGVLPVKENGVVVGWLVPTFALQTTRTFLIETVPYGDGWSPKSGYEAAGFSMPTDSSELNGNAYAMIFVNADNPLKALTQAQIDMLAYVDCTNDSKIGPAVCMIGMKPNDYMQGKAGYPDSQVITKQ